MDEDLIDRIHECAFDWPNVLGQLATIASARSGWIFVASDDGPCLDASAEIGSYDHDIVGASIVAFDFTNWIIMRLPCAQQIF